MVANFILISKLTLPLHVASCSWTIYLDKAMVKVLIIFCMCTRCFPCNLEPTDSILCFTYFRSDRIPFYSVRDTMLLLLMTAAVEVLSTLKYSQVRGEALRSLCQRPKQATENIRQSKTKPSRIIHVTMLIEFDLLKCLWVLLDEVTLCSARGFGPEHL